MRYAHWSIVIVCLVGCSSGGEPGGSGWGTASGTGAPSGGSSGGASSSTGSSSSDKGTGGTSSSGGSGADPSTPEDAGVTDSSSGDASSSSSSGSSTADAGSTEQAPTWSAIYGSYLATGTIGSCGGCHAEATGAPGAYSFIQGYGYLNGAQSNLSSLFSWMGGPMPPGGPTSNAQATAAVQAWVAAGAVDD
jgi:hypothetical protein